MSRKMNAVPIDVVIKRWPTKNARQWLKQFLADVSEDANVLAVITIGSAVRSSVDTDDLDIIAICRNKRSFDYRAPIEVDLRAFEYGDVEAKLASGNDLLGWTVKFGRTLYDRNDSWSETRQRWLDRIPLPNPDVARNRAVKTEAQMREMLKVGDIDAANELRLSRLTHLARATLSEAGVYPASRPELPSQLEVIKAYELALELRAALAQRSEDRAVEEPAV